MRYWGYSNNNTFMPAASKWAHEVIAIPERNFTSSAHLPISLCMLQLFLETIEVGRAILLPLMQARISASWISALQSPDLTLPKQPNAKGKRMIEKMLTFPQQQHGQEHWATVNQLMAYEECSADGQ